MSGVALSNDRDGVRKKRYVHIQCNEWDVTSDHPVSDVPYITVLDRVLPGRLGSYIYPRDAVFACLDRQVTKKSDLDSVIQREKSKRVGVQHINHISVSTNETDANDLDFSKHPCQDDASEDDDDEFVDDDDAECDDVAEPIPWDDDDEPEWRDKSK